MNDLIAQLTALKPVMFKKLAWIRLSPETEFYHELFPEWFGQLKVSLEKISNIKVMGYATSSSCEFQVNIAFLTPEAHLDFIQHFYVQGEVKELFKNHMRHSTKNNVAFHMSSVLPPTWHNPNDQEAIKAHVLYEICPPGIKMHAATKEHRNSFDFFQWMLFLPNTCSVSAYYDYKHNARHIQTLYKKYDSTVHEKVIAESDKYPSFFKNRYDYNLINGIIHKQGMSPHHGSLSVHNICEPEFLNSLEYNSHPIVLNLF